MPFAFGTLATAELVEARREVEEWAEELLADQLHTWDERRRKRLESKPRPPTRAECFEKSREIRIKRERNSTYWNQLDNPTPTR